MISVTVRHYDVMSTSAHLTVHGRWPNHLAPYLEDV